MTTASFEQKPALMKPRCLRNLAFTVVELVVVVAALGLLTALFVHGQADPMERARAHRIACVNNLRQLGLAFRLWSKDHNENFPMQYSSDKGGSREGIDKEEARLHFMALSNELSNPKVLVCPADNRQSATSFSNLTATNLSYFVGIDADESIPFMLLAGDRNVTNGIALKKGIIELTDAPPAGWTETIHLATGDFVYSDGSVMQATTGALRRSVAHSNDSNGFGKTRLQLPIAPTAP
jgi:type II secretory pathway pseudopilin PulG